MKRYLHYDVFTSKRFSGNQLAVLPDARGLTSATMQHIANEMNFSETTFLLPPEHEDTHARMRIFTPAAELPMAGHPTVGTTFALAHEGIITPGTKEFVFGLGIGPTPVELEWREDSLAFAWMVQPLPEFGATLEDRTTLARSLGISPHDLSETLPSQIVSAGVEFLLVPLRTRAAVDAITLERPTLQRLFEAAGLPERGVLAFHPEPDRELPGSYTRMFAPCLGVAEDPATGSASGPLGAYLFRQGVVTTAQATRLLSLQGVKMGRPSSITISLTTSQETIQGAGWAVRPSSSGRGL
jgi:trans-2,3-dihydro-3-hydroxyanthranilate isomerase